MIEMLVETEDGEQIVYFIETNPLDDKELLDWITCTCGVVVPQGKVCGRPGCRQRTQGPSVENQTRKILTGELDATA